MAVFDLHVHTVRGSSDSSLTPDQLVEAALEIGLDGVCLTEHSGGWEPVEIERVFRGSGLTVVSGLEVDTDMGHVIVFGLASYVNGIHKIAELRKVVDAAGGVMVSAHPFRNLFNSPPYDANLVFRGWDHKPKTVEAAASHPLFELVDDVEVANGANTDKENLFCLKVARHLGLRGTAGSDAHSTHGIGRCVTVFDGDVASEADLIEAMKARAYTPGEGFHVGRLTTFDIPSSHLMGAD